MRRGRRASPRRPDRRRRSPAAPGRAFRSVGATTIRALGERAGGSDRPRCASPLRRPPCAISRTNCSVWSARQDETSSAAARRPRSSKIGAVVHDSSVLRVKKCWPRWIVTARCSIRQVPMPLVPSASSLHTAPVHSPQASKVLSSATSPRRSSDTPSRSAKTVEQPAPPTARNRRSSAGPATASSGSADWRASSSRRRRAGGRARRRSDRVGEALRNAAMRRPAPNATPRQKRRPQRSGPRGRKRVAPPSRVLPSGEVS